MGNVAVITRLALGISAVIFSGYNILFTLFKNNLNDLKPLEQISLSYAIGVSMISLEMFVLALFGIAWSFANLAMPWILLFLINLAWFFKNKKKHPAVAVKNPPLSLIEKILLCGIALEVIYVISKALTLPLEAPDAIAIYAIKAKAFYLKGGIDLEIFKNAVFRESHPDYPLLLPLAECWMYKALGSLNDLLVKIIFPIYFLSTLAIFYSVLRRFVERKGAILLAFMLSTIPQFSNFGTNGYADLLVSCYYTAGFLYLFLWMKERTLPYLILSGLMSFSAVWTKNEGWMLSGANLFILILFLAADKTKLIKKIFWLSAYVMPIIILVSPWLFFKRHLGLESDIIMRATLTPARIIENAGRVWPILYEYQKHVFGPKMWNIAWLLIILVLVLKFKDMLNGDKKYILLAMALCVMGYSLVYIITPQGLGWHLSTSASRIMLHFLPVSMFWLALSTKKELNAFCNVPL